MRVYDPAAMKECRRRIGDSVYYATDMYDAALDADALMLVTEWKEFRIAVMGSYQKGYENSGSAGTAVTSYEKKEIEELDLPTTA
mgnify:CR=1 FL=1